MIEDALRMRSVPAVLNRQTARESSVPSSLTRMLLHVRVMTKALAMEKRELEVRRKSSPLEG